MPANNFEFEYPRSARTLIMCHGFKTDCSWIKGVSQEQSASDTSIWFNTITWVKHGRGPLADSYLASRETKS
jgi:hypothetical protein